MTISGEPKKDPPPPPVVPKCPECDTELVLINGEPPEKCAKCGFVLEGYEVFFRWFKKAMKAYEDGKTPPKPPDTPAPPVSRKNLGPLSRLGQRRK